MKGSKAHTSWPSTPVDVDSSYREDGKVPCHCHPSKQPLILSRVHEFDGVGGACCIDHASNQLPPDTRSQVTIVPQLHDYLIPLGGPGEGRSAYPNQVCTLNALPSRNIPKKNTNS